MKKIVKIILCFFVMAFAVGFAMPVKAQLSAVSLKFDLDSGNYSFSAGTPAAIYLIATNTSSSSISFYGVDVVFAYNPAALSVAMDKNFAPTVSAGGEWTWSSDTGPAGSEITVIGTTNTQITLDAGGSAQIAKFIFTPAANSSVTLDKATARVIQVQTDDNVFDSTNTPDSQPYNVGVTIAPTATPYVAYPGQLGTAGPTENVFFALGGGLAIVLLGYGIMRAKRNKVRSRKNDEFIEGMFK